MKKNTVVVFGICAVAGLEAIALLKGINGTVFATSMAALGTMIGYVFGAKGEAAGAPARAAVAGLLLSFGLMGCGTTVEACYVHPEYGQVCVSYNGKLHVRADIKGVRLTEVVNWLKETYGVDVESD